MVDTSREVGGGKAAHQPSEEEQGGPDQLSPPFVRAARPAGLAHPVPPAPDEDAGSRSKLTVSPATAVGRRTQIQPGSR